ncbi:MAG: histidine--tRNA ligase [Ignavibacteria bacterium GWA2_35_9]|nr:MAG: histidine--tRNA ligase [Ignavibacteria bacterium GWA2_35_9]OGU46858.1 MAG: histidine--tRNA ligase [Ignavibacteria bacterium GWB2_36_8]OGU48274.1 MAG: histidine--tRNA ligase [Ignavibacteria bacterium GWC2_36_12]
MMIKAVTGTKDILPDEIPAWKLVEKTIERIFHNFNYKEIRTPVFEETSLFARGIGEETDIVGKEMYSFTDRSENNITLKPEMTASVVRAFIEHSLGKQQSLNKLYYVSPMFRQERPQAGRLRQFHQFGAEALGSTSVYLDVEMIQMAFEILKELGLKDLNVKINSLGTPESRNAYKEKLRKFLIDKKNKLSEDSRKRFDKNILRIFDSKDENDKKIMKDAPLLLDHLDSESKESFEIVKETLKLSGIPFEVDPYLVRGLDYYTKTTFEIISGKVGSQNALCGGGRYDLLAEHLEGEPTPGVGFAAGIERILLACENEKSLKSPEENIDLFITRLDDELSQKVFEIALNFRRKNLSVDCDYLDRSLKAQMREANKLKAKYVLFIGGDEYKSGMANLKNMESGEQKLVQIDKLDEVLLSQK